MDPTARQTHNPAQTPPGQDQLQHQLLPHAALAVSHQHIARLGLHLLRRLLRCLLRLLVTCSVLC